MSVFFSGALDRGPWTLEWIDARLLCVACLHPGWVDGLCVCVCVCVCVWPAWILDPGSCVDGLCLCVACLDPGSGVGGLDLCVACLDPGSWILCGMDARLVVACLDP